MANKVKLKRGDQVRVITGKDKGKSGKVLFIDREKNRAIVEGLNQVTKHQKPNRANQRGGITHLDAPIHISNLMYLHRGKPTRISIKAEVTDTDGVKKINKQRIAVSTGDVID